MNIIVTRQLGTAIRRLQNNERINRIRRRRQQPYYLWAPDGSGNVNRVSDEIVKQLEKLKFVTSGSPDYGERYWQYSNRVYRATDRCAMFKLPPEEFWVEE